jgi:hypothetical protein
MGLAAESYGAVGVCVVAAGVEGGDEGEYESSEAAFFFFSSFLRG